MHRSLLAKIVAGFASAMLILGTIAVLSYRSTQSFLATAERVAHTRQVLENVESVAHLLAVAESAALGFALTKDERHLVRFDRTQQQVVRRANDLKALVANQPDQARRVEHIGRLAAALLASQAEEIDRSTSSLDANNTATQALEELEIQKTRVFGELDALRADEEKDLARHTNLARNLARASGIVIALGVSLAFALTVASILLIRRDIRARQRAEARLARQHELLRTVIDTLPDQVSVLDSNGRCIVSNLHHRNWLREKVLPTAGTLGANDPAIANLEENLEVLQTGRSTMRIHSHVQADGSERWFTTRKTPFRGPDGTVAGIVTVTSDITTHKEAEAALRLSALQLKKHNDELQEFASVASHDLQEPLRKILAFGDRLFKKCNDALGEDGRDYLARILNAAQRMQNLVEGLLTLARVSRHELRFSSVNLTDVARGVLSDLELRIEQTRARIQLDPLPVIDANPVHMRQLLQNLISNALKYHSPDRTPEIRICAVCRPSRGVEIHGVQPGAEVCDLIVEDNGIGFEEKFAQRIFEPFLRLHGRHEYSGTGIGLTVVRRIVERHGGAVTAQGSPGRGAKFIVTLPVKQTNKTADEQKRHSNHDPDG